MNLRPRRVIVAAFLALAAPGLPAAEPGEVSEADLAKITIATPARAQVKPAQARKLLVFGRCTGFRHGSIPYGAAAFRIVGETTGAFEAVVSEDEAMFEPETLKQFDAVCMNNTTGELFLPKDVDKLPDAEKAEAQARTARLRQSLLDFVRNGKGLVGVHAATDCSYRWTEYGDMLGAYFWGHPWSEQVGITLDDPGHALCRAFKGQPFSVNDEIYQFREPYSRDKLRVLLSIDPTRTNMNKGDKIKRTDGDFAVSWLHEYGEGRVFFCSLGHRNDIFWNPTVLAFYLDGIQYAMGDLPADATPSSRLSQSYLKQSRVEGREAGLDAMFGEMLAYQVGGDDANARRIAALVLEAQHDEVERRALVRRLTGLLGQGASIGCKRFACRQLRLIGTPAAVPAIAPLLTDPKLSDMARYALERLPGRMPDRALLASLPSCSGRVRIGIVNTLGARRPKAAVTALTELLAADDVDAARAAAAALGKIASREAAAALADARVDAPDDRRPALDHALLACAEALLAQRGMLKNRARRHAGEICKMLFASATQAPDDVRAGAFFGLVLSQGARGLDMAVDALVGNREYLRYAAARVARDLPGANVARAFADALHAMRPANQIVTINALAARGDRSVLPAVLACVSCESEDVRLAAVEALQVLGDPTVVLPLAGIAAGAEPNGPLQKAARRSLDRLSAPGVDAMTEYHVAQSDSPVRAELVRALGTRGVTPAVPTVLQAARDDDSGVRKAALKGLGLLAEPMHLRDVVALLLATEAKSEASELERIAVSVSRRIQDPAQQPEAVLDALAGDIRVETRCSLLSALGKIGVAAGLEALYAALDQRNDEVRKAAIRALADWPDASPMARLREISKDSPDPVQRVLALRGYARQLALPTDRPTRDTLRMYTEALALAKTDQERKTLLGGLGDVPHPETLKILESNIGDKAVQAEAIAAACKVLQALDGAAMKLTASHGQGAEKNATDGTRDTRWTTGAPMKGGEWFQVDIGYETDVTEIMLDAGPIGTDYPRGYEVYVSRDGKEWGQSVVTGKGTEKIFTVKIPPTYGRYVKILQTGQSGGNYWSIAELQVNGRPKHLGTGAELDRSKWTVSASKCNENAPKAIDGDLEERWGTGEGQRDGDWFMVDLGEERTVHQVILNAAKSGSDYPRRYEVHVSRDGETWEGPVSMGEGKTALTKIHLLPRLARYVKIVQTGFGDRWWWSIYDLKVIAE